MSNYNNNNSNNSNNSSVKKFGRFRESLAEVDRNSKSLDSLQGKTKAAEIQAIRQKYEQLETNAPMLFSQLFPEGHGTGLPARTNEEAKYILKSRFSKMSKVGNMIGMYTREGKLGTGSFSTVYKARCIVTGRRYAMKVIPFYRMSSSTQQQHPSPNAHPNANTAVNRIANNNNLQDQKSSGVFGGSDQKNSAGVIGNGAGGLEPCHLAILNEIYLQSYLQQWDSRFTVQLFDVFRTTSAMVLIQEYCEGGDLFHYVTANYGSFDRREMVEALAKCISFMHSHGVIHRDLKLENIFVFAFSKKTGGAPCVKLGDLGLSKRINDQSWVSGSCGSREYMAPEIWLEPVYDGYLADVWALGILAYAIYNKYFPFETQKPVFWKQLCQGILLPMRPNVPASMKSIIVRMLSTDVSVRPRMFEVERAFNGSSFVVDEACASSGSDTDV